MGGRLRIRTSIRSAIACIGAFIERWCPVTNGIRSGFRSTFETTTALTSSPGHDREDYDDTIDSTRGSALSGWDPSQSNTTGTDCASKALHFMAVRRKRWATCTSWGMRWSRPSPSHQRRRMTPSLQTANMSASHPIVATAVTSVDDDEDASGRRTGTNERAGYTTPNAPSSAALAKFS